MVVRQTSPLKNDTSKERLACHSWLFFVIWTISYLHSEIMLTISIAKAIIKVNDWNTVMLTPPRRKRSKQTHQESLCENYITIFKIKQTCIWLMILCVDFWSTLFDLWSCFKEDNTGLRRKISIKVLTYL